VKIHEITIERRFRDRRISTGQGGRLEMACGGLDESYGRLTNEKSSQKCLGTASDFDYDLDFANSRCLSRPLICLNNHDLNPYLFVAFAISPKEEGD
jgi:hypothetical protein